MMQDTCSTAALYAAPRSRPASGGYVTVGTMILAAVSAAMLVLMSGCHWAPATNAFAGSAADKAREARLQQADTMAPLQPFDEHFVVSAEPEQ